MHIYPGLIIEIIQHLYMYAQTREEKLELVKS